MQRLPIAVLCLVVWPAVALAQHAGHGQAGPPKPTDAQVVEACVRSQQQAAALAAHIHRRLEAARQTNSPSEMRASMDDLQAALVELQAVLKACDPLQAAAAPADPHAGHNMGGTAPAAAATEEIDPVCSMKVDPKTAPSAEYQGRRYYFCNEGDRQLFLKDPGKYVKK